MPTKQDVLAAKSVSIQTIDAEIVAAATLQNSSSLDDSHKMEPEIQRMRDRRTEIATQAYVAALDDPALQQALNKIEAATADMTTVAQNMKTVTGFLSNAASFLSAAGGVLSALKGA